MNLNFGNIQGLFRTMSVFRLSLFLLLCFVLGGTSQDIVTPKLPLYLISLMIIGGCLMRLDESSNLWKLKGLLIVLGTLLCGYLIYLVPLPPGIWSNLPGRDFIAQGYVTIGADLPWLPLSVTPEKTLFSLFDFLPAMALILMIGTVVTSRELRAGITTIGIFIIFSVVLGLLQVLNIADSLYLYSFTNENSAVGFFSNANHFGGFLLLGIPLAMCASQFSQGYDEDDSNRILAFSIICILTALLGIGVSGSLGSYLLIFPVLAATLFIWSGTSQKKNIFLVLILMSVIGVFLFDMFVWGNLQEEFLAKFTSIDSTSRQTIFQNSYEMSKIYLPIGTGPGSYPDVYRLVEDATRRTVNHAHNDYIEMFAEFGIFGLVWMVAALAWIGKNIVTALRFRRRSGRIAQYMSVGIMTIIIYSVFDYPLRTISIMTLFVFCMCILILSNHSLSSGDGEKRGLML